MVVELPIEVVRRVSVAPPRALHASDVIFGLCKVRKQPGVKVESSVGVVVIGIEGGSRRVDG